MAKNELVAFDYSDLDADTKGKLLSYTADANRAIKKYGAGILELGETCFNANELLAGQGREGKFKPWVEMLGISRQSAYEAMNVFERSQDFPCIATFPTTVALVLSKPGVPDAAIKSFQKKVDKGLRPTVAAAKAAVDEHKEVSDKSDTSAPTLPEPEEFGAGEGGSFDEPSIDHPDEPPVPVVLATVNEDSEPVEVTLEYRMAEWNKAVESLARAVSSALDDAITGPWLGESDDDNRLGIAKTQLKSAAATIRLAKCPHVCCKCDGKGCKACRESGMMPKNTYEMMGGK